MENFFFALKVVFPVFSMMLIGYILKNVGIIGEITVKQINKMLFWLCLPLAIFRNIYNSDIAASFKSGLVIFTVIAIISQFLIGLVLIPIVEKDSAKRGVMLQGLFRSNFVYFALPIAAAIAGSVSTGITSLLIAFVIPLFNLLAVISLEIYRGGRPNFFKILKGILTNPLIIASVAAVLFVNFNITIPAYIESLMGDLGSISTTLAFIMLGAYFNFSDVKQYLKQISIITVLKIFVFPAAIIFIAVLLGFRGSELAVILSVFAAPLAINSFTMAQEMGGDERLAGQLVVFTSIFSIAGIFLFVFILKQLAFI